MGDAPEGAGQRIHRLRVERGLTQRDLAEPKYTAAYVSSVESGRRSPSADALRHFAGRLGISEHELATGRDADATVELELALVQAMASGTGLAEVAHNAGQAGDRRRQAWALLALDPQEHLDEAAALLEGEPPPDRITLVLARAARAEPRYAIHLMEEALDELYRNGFPEPDARHALCVHLAERYLEIGDEDRAGTAAEQALALAGPLDPAAAANDYLTTARSLLEARRPAAALLSLGQARALLRRVRFDSALSACYRARGWMRRDAGELENAAADLTRARQLSGGTGAALDIGVELAEVQRRRGRPDLAEQLVSDALGAVDDEAPLRLARAWREWGLLALERGEVAQAEERLRNAVALYGRGGPRHELARVLRALGDLLCEQDRLAEAAEVLRSGLIDLERIGRG